MARSGGLIDFSPMYMGKTGDKTGDIYSGLIQNVSNIAANTVANQQLQKQLLQGEIQERQRATGEFINQSVKTAAQNYASKINQENIDLLHKNRFYTSPADKAAIQNNLLKIDDFANQLKAFELMSKKAFDEYNSSNGMSKYEDPTPFFEQVLSAISPDPNTGEINESNFRVALNAFQETDSKLPGLNFKPLSPDEYIVKYADNWKKSHAAERPLEPKFEVRYDPKLGKSVKYEVKETPVDWSGFNRTMINAMISDESGRQMAKFVAQNLTEEQKQEAINKYSLKDDFGRPIENPLIPMMEYYAVDVMGIDKKKENIIEYGALTPVSSENKSGKGSKEDKYLPKDITLKNQTYSGFTLYNAIDNPDAKRKPYNFKGSRVIKRNGTLGPVDNNTVTFESPNDRIASISTNDGTMVLVRNISAGGTTIPEYRFIPLKGNEQAAKEYLGEEKYNEMISNMNNEELSSQEYNDWFSQAKQKAKTDNTSTEDIFKQMLMAGDIGYPEYERFMNMLKNDPDKRGMFDFAKPKKLGEK